jgi:hypothetical protein
MFDLHFSLLNLCSNPTNRVLSVRLYPVHDQLHFDEDQKIIRQVDWIEYAPQTLQRVIDRARDKGVQTVPDWLDLSRD